jgi:hypothetical protein
MTQIRLDDWRIALKRGTYMALVKWLGRSDSSQEQGIVCLHSQVLCRCREKMVRSIIAEQDTLRQGGFLGWY